MEHLSFTIACYVFSATVTACTTAFGIFLRRIIRIIGVFRDFPPHAHVEDDILYPDGFHPPKVQKLKSKGAGQ